MKSKRSSRSFRFSWSAMEDRLVMAAPVLGAISTQTVPAGKTLMLPVTATDADGDPITYTVSSNNNTVAAVVRTNHPYVKMTVAGYGDMVFQLFDDITPVAVQNITALVNAGSYNGLTFHRVISGFMNQGGDPKGDGTGSLIANKFSDEFSPEAIFSGDGQLAMANSGKDTNGSQFFITNGPQRFLDFNHDIFGQLVRGFDVNRAINAAAVGANSKPVTPIVITSMSMVTDTTDAVLQLKSSGEGVTQFTITASDGTGNSDSKTFTVNSTADTTDDPPILGPVTDQVTYTNTPVSIPLSAFDYENNPLTFDAAVITNTTAATSSASGNVITVTPAQGFKGSFQLIVGVRQTDATARGSTSNPWDTQVITVTVGDPITIASQAVSAQEGASLASTTVATFSALKPKAANAYTASINWGDGRTSLGTVLDTGNGTFAVKGNGSYAKYGSYPISVTITDTVENLFANGTTTATVTDAPLTGVFIAPARQPGAGQISGLIAEFTDTNSAGQASDLSASINWGDGTTSAGTITSANGKFQVSGSRTYTALATFNVVVSLTSSGGSQASATGSIVVANASPVFGAIGTQNVDEGKALSFSAKATDTDTWQTLSYKFTGSVPSTFTISPSTGQVDVAANTVPGDYNINIAVSDNGVPSRTTQTAVRVSVKNLAPQLSLANTVQQSLQFGETLTLTGSVTDVATTKPLTTQVDYGTGSGYLALPVAADGTFTLNKTYTTAGTYTVSVKSTDAQGAASVKSFQVVVQPPSLIMPTSQAIVSRSKTGQVLGITLYFSNALDPALARNKLNYQIISSFGRDKLPGTRDDVKLAIASVSYNAASKSVTIIPVSKFIPGSKATFLVRAMGLKDTFGRLVDGNRDGNAGGDVYYNLTKTGITLV